MGVALVLRRYDIVPSTCSGLYTLDMLLVADTREHPGL